MIDMDKSHNGSILTWIDVGLIFSSFNAMHARKSPKKLFWLVPLDEVCLMSSYRSILCKDKALYSLASPQTSFGVRLSRIECVTNEPQRTSAGGYLKL